MAERRRTFEELSYGRIASWGAAGGVLLALPFSLLRGDPALALVLIATLAGLGAGSASGWLALARRGDRPSLHEPDRLAVLGSDQRP